MDTRRQICLVGRFAMTFAILSASCTSKGSAVAGISPSSTSSPSVSASPTPPPEPAVSQGRIQGTYRFIAVQTSSNVTGGPASSVYKWSFKPTCPTGGGCDVRLHSLTGKYKIGDVPFVKNSYFFSRRVPGWYTCGSQNVLALLTFNFRVTNVQLMGSEWVATRIEGTEVDTGITVTTCGKIQEKFVLKGSLIG
jgi:hypothetical protein